MRTDPRIGFWISLGMVVLGLGWLGAFALGGERLGEILGDATDVITVLAILLLVGGIVAALLYARFMRVRRDLLAGGDAVARWTVDPDLWRLFAEQAGEDTRAGRGVLFATILLVDLVVAGALAAIQPEDAVIILAVGLAIAAVAGLGLLLGRWGASDHLTYRTGEAIVGRRGMLVNGVLHVWSYPGARLDDVHVPADAPDCVAFVYSWIGRAGRRYATVLVPAPEDQKIAELRAAVGLRPGA